MSLIKGLLWLVIVAVTLTIIGRIFFFEVAQTESFSMIPSIMPGDTVMVFTRGVLGPGEVALCKDPENPDQMVVGRIMGVPGSTFALDNNAPIINGMRIHHAFDLPPLLYEDKTGGETFEYTIDVATEKVAGHVYNVALMDRAGDKSFKETEIESGFFLIGDNRNKAWDSRHFGEIPIEDCIGTPIMVIWPGPDSGDFKFKNRFLEWIH